MRTTLTEFNWGEAPSVDGALVDRTSTCTGYSVNLLRFSQKGTIV